MEKHSKNKYDLRIVSQLFYPEMVSSGQALTELVEELSLKGLKVKVIASQPTILGKSDPVPKFINYKNIHIIRTWSPRLPKLSFLGKLINLLTFSLTSSIDILFRDRKVPVIFVTNPPFIALLGWLTNIFSKTKFGVLLFDIMPEQAELLGIIKRNGLLSRLWRMVNHLWYLRASFVIVLSNDMLEGALDNANMKDSIHETKCRAKTKIIHVWSDDRIIKPLKKCDSKLAEELNVKNKFVVQYSGNHGRFHDIDTMLKITETMSDDPRVIFQFIGEGFKKKVVNKFVSEKNYSNVYSSTYVPKDMLPDSLAMADLGVIAQLPGQERVCYPSKLLGIMSAGKAILAICSNQSEMAKMISDNDLGFVIENGDIEAAVKLINMCIADPSLIELKGKNAFNYLKDNLSLKKAADEYFNLVNSV